jgi:hypothetical protein
LSSEVRASGAALEMIAADADLTLARWQNVVIYVWVSAPSIANLQRLERASDQAFARFGPLGSVSISPPGAVLPDEKARRYAADQMRRTEHQTLATAVIVEAEGFAGSAARAALTAINTFSGLRSRTQVFRDAPGAARWLALKVSRPTAVDALLSAIVATRAAAAPFVR